MMTPEEAIHRIQDHMRVHKIGEYPHILLKEALDMAIAALRDQEERDNRLESDAVKNEPLTMDELRKMNGEPIWIDTGEMSLGEQICGSWEIFTHCENDTYYFTRRLRGFLGKDYGVTWIAYRSKPKEMYN